jgi:hypothetical protein
VFLALCDIIRLHIAQHAAMQERYTKVEHLVEACLSLDESFESDKAVGGSGELSRDDEVIDTIIDLASDLKGEETDCPRTGEWERLVVAVDEFADIMTAKLMHKYIEGFTGWDDPSKIASLQSSLAAHTRDLISGSRTQAVDVATLAMFLYFLNDG